MNAEKASQTSNNLNSENNFNTTPSQAEKDKQNRSLGSKIIDVIKNILPGRAEKEKGDRWLLSEYYSSEIKKSKFWKNLCKQHDNCGVDMPREMGEVLEKYAEDPNMWFGIHRTSAISDEQFENDAILQDIMNGGLENAGDANSCVITKNPPISKTVTECPNVMDAVILSKHPRNGSTGAVYVAIPQEYLDKNDGVKEEYIDKVYDNSNKTRSSRIRPEFLVGFAKYSGPGHALQYKSREEILKAADKNQQQ